MRASATAETDVMADLKVELFENLIVALKKEAERSIPSDTDEDFDPQDYAGGNFDDAYELGVSHGSIESARWILNSLGIQY